MLFVDPPVFDVGDVVPPLSVLAGTGRVGRLLVLLFGLCRFGVDLRDLYIRLRDLGVSLRRLDGLTGRHFRLGPGRLHRWRLRARALRGGALRGGTLHGRALHRGFRDRSLRHRTMNRCRLGRAALGRLRLRNRRLARGRLRGRLRRFSRRNRARERKRNEDSQSSHWSPSSPHQDARAVPAVQNCKYHQLNGLRTFKSGTGHKGRAKLTALISSCGI